MDAPVNRPPNRRDVTDPAAQPYPTDDEWQQATGQDFWPWVTQLGCAQMARDVSLVPPAPLPQGAWPTWEDLRKRVLDFISGLGPIVLIPVTPVLE